jgi:hypothetical protein
VNHPKGIRIKLLLKVFEAASNNSLHTWGLHQGVLLIAAKPQDLVDWNKVGG